MKIECHVKEMKTDIHCGQGNKTIRWLADAATIWYIETNNTQLKKQKITSASVKVMKNTGEVLNMDEEIANVLNNNDSVYVYFKEDLQWESLGKGK